MNVGNNPLYGGEHIAIGTWDAAATTLATNASASCTNGSIWLPDGALVTKAYYFVQTTFVDDDAGDSQPMALGYTGATGAFVASIAISATGTNGVAGGQWDAGIHGTLVGMGAALGADADHNAALEVIALNAATMSHLTAPKELLLTLADERTVAIGKLSLYVHYVQTNDFA